MALTKERFEKHHLHEYVDVHVSHVYTPEDFYVQRNDKYDLLGDLEQEMTLFYDKKDNDYAHSILQGMPVPGSMLACKYRSGPKNEAPTWLRCLALSPAKPDTISVFMVDYGTTQQVVLNDAKYLSKKFMNLPSQAIRARLSGIHPFEGFKWSLEAKKLLSEKAQTTYRLGGMVARVDGYSMLKCGFKASLRLIDTVTNDIPDGIVINDTLIDLGLAERDFPVYVNDNRQFDPTEKVLHRSRILPEVVF